MLTCLLLTTSATSHDQQLAIPFMDRIKVDVVTDFMLITSFKDLVLRLSMKQ
jgi:hypothetical protein